MLTGLLLPRWLVRVVLCPRDQGPITRGDGRGLRVRWPSRRGSSAAGRDQQGDRSDCLRRCSLKSREGGLGQRCQSLNERRPLYAVVRLLPNVFDDVYTFLSAPFPSQNQTTNDLRVVQRHRHLNGMSSCKSQNRLVGLVAVVAVSRAGGAPPDHGRSHRATRVSTTAERRRDGTAMMAGPSTRVPQPGSLLQVRAQQRTQCKLSANRDDKRTRRVHSDA